MRTTDNTHIWTDERVAILKEIHSSGEVDRTRIAALLNERTGSSFAPDAVGGKLFRILGRKTPIRTPEQKAADKEASRQRRNERKRAKRAAARNNAGTARKKSAAPALVKVPFTPRSADVVSRRVTILDLQAMECRWPDEYRNEDNQITFCGNRTADGSSYCPCHAALAVGPGTQSERAAIRNARAIGRAVA